MADLGEIRREQNGTPTKWEVYEQILKVPNYIAYDRYKDKLWIFLLKEGEYREQSITDNRFWFDNLGVGIGLWQGEYAGITRPWLRWYDGDGDWVPTQDEQLDRERSRAELELRQRQEAEQRAEQERSRADRLAEKLRELGVNPDEG